jgi:pilus assembly protein CpaB
MKGFILMLMASLCIGSSVFLMNYYFFVPTIPSAGKIELPIVAEEVLCLLKDVKRGVFLTEETLTFCPVDRNAVKHRYYTADQLNSLKIENSVFVKFVPKGEYLTKELFLKPEERGYLGAFLEPEERVKIVSINNLDDYSTILHPGDPVDLLLTYKVKNSKGDLDEIVTLPLVENVRVVRIDGNDDQTGTKSSGPNSKQFGQVTLAMSVHQVSRVTVAEQTGAIDILLRVRGSGASASEYSSRDFAVGEKQAAIFEAVSNGGLSSDVPQSIRLLKGSEISFLERPGPFAYVGKGINE